MIYKFYCVIHMFHWITLSIAKIVSSIREAHARKRVNIYHQAFGSVLQDDNSNPDQSIFHALVKATDAKLPDFKSQALANTAYAYALLGYDPKIDERSLLGGIAEKSIDCMHQFEPQHLANTVWSYAKLNVDNPRLFQSVGDIVARQSDLNEFKPQDFANIVWAYAKNSVQHPNLFQKVGDTIASSDGSKVFTTQDLSNIVWAYAKLDVKHPGLFEKIGKSIGALNDLSSFNSQALSNIAWSFAVADVNVPVAFNDAFIRALVRKQNEFNVKELTQLYQWHVWQAEEKSFTGLPEVLRERCEQAFKNSRSSISTINNTADVHPKQTEADDSESFKLQETQPENVQTDLHANTPHAHRSLKDQTDFESFTVPQLKGLLRSKGLKVGGRKEELIERLLKYA